jgi:tetratricopeptide (TPR) repeat protein
MGQHDQAIAEGRRALELDPLSIRIHRNQAARFYHARLYDEAVRQYGEALELDPNDSAVRQELGDVYEQMGLEGEAVAEWRTAMTLTADNELAAILDSAYAEGGFAHAVRAVAQKKLERLGERVQKGEYVPLIYFARTYVTLGDKEQTFRWLDKACEERNAFALFLNTDPFYGSLRSDLRFADLLRRAGLTS